MSAAPEAVSIRDERRADHDAIAALITAAFATAPRSSGSEARIVAGLRDAGALTLSLVAARDGAVAGHAAFSPVRIDGRAGGWFGLGPVAVRPGLQRQGIGEALIREGLCRLAEEGADGCVVLGDPAYYGRFGFNHDPVLTYPVPEPEAFQRLVLRGHPRRGAVTYHPAFDLA